MLNIGMLKQTVAFLKIVSSVAGFILVREYSRSGGGMTTKSSFKNSGRISGYSKSNFSGGRSYAKR